MKLILNLPGILVLDRHDIKRLRAAAIDRMKLQPKLRPQTHFLASDGKTYPLRGNGLNAFFLKPARKSLTPSPLERGGAKRRGV